MRNLILLAFLGLTACASHEERQPPCPQPRAMNAAPQRNSVVLQRENLIPVHVAYVQLPYIDAGAVLMMEGGEHVLYRGVPPDNRAQVAQMEPPPPAINKAAPVTPGPMVPPPLNPAPKPPAAKLWKKPGAAHAKVCACGENSPQNIAPAGPTKAAAPQPPAATTATPGGGVTYQAPPPGPGPAPAPNAQTPVR